MGEGTSPAEGHVRPEHWPQLGNSPGATGCLWTLPECRMARGMLQGRSFPHGS